MLNRREFIKTALLLPAFGVAVPVIAVPTSEVRPPRSLEGNGLILGYLEDSGPGDIVERRKNKQEKWEFIRAEWEDYLTPTISESRISELRWLAIARRAPHYVWKWAYGHVPFSRLVDIEYQDDTEYWIMTFSPDGAVPC